MAKVNTDDYVVCETPEQEDRLMQWAADNLTDEQRWHAHTGEVQHKMELIDDRVYQVLRDYISEELSAMDNRQFLERISEFDPDALGEIFGGWDEMAEQMAESGFVKEA